MNPYLERLEDRFFTCLDYGVDGVEFLLCVGMCCMVPVFLVILVPMAALGYCVNCMRRLQARLKG